jgi:hypothetical protein
MAKLYVFHQGGGNNGQLWYTVFDDKNQGADALIHNLRIADANAASPSAVAWAGGISVFYQGAVTTDSFGTRFPPMGQTGSEKH